MTEEVCNQLIALGGREYPYQKKSLNPGGRVFQMPAWGDSAPLCETNDGKMSLHVKVLPDFEICGHHVKGGVTFEAFGEAGGRWVRFEIYTVKLEEAVGFLPRADIAARAMWRAFVHSMKS